MRTEKSKQEVNKLNLRGSGKWINMMEFRNLASKGVRLLGRDGDIAVEIGLNRTLGSLFVDVENTAEGKRIERYNTNIEDLLKKYKSSNIKKFEMDIRREIKKWNVFKALNKVRHDLNEIENINRGGCGLSAYVMGCILEREGLVWEKDFDVVFVYCSNTDFNHNSLNMNMGMAGTAPQHCGIRLFGEFLDCSEDMHGYIKKYDCKYKHSVSKDFLVKTIKDKGADWNALFNRSSLKALFFKYKLDKTGFRIW